MTAINAQNLSEVAGLRLPLTNDFALFPPAAQDYLLNYDLTESRLDLNVEVRQVDDVIQQYLPECADIINEALLDLDQNSSSNSSFGSSGVANAQTSKVAASKSSRLSAAQLNAAADSQLHQQQMQQPASSSSSSSATNEKETCSSSSSNSSSDLPKTRPSHEERRFACQLCGKAFKRHDHLNGHLITHREKKPFECTFKGCSKSYCDARSLKRHQDNHHSNGTDPATTSTTPTTSTTSTTATTTKKSKAKSSKNESSNEGLTTQQLELIQEIMRQTQEQHRLLQEEQQRQQQLQQQQQQQQKTSKSKKSKNKSTSDPADGNIRPVECTVCQRKFKNIPALNGHMRLHGGFLKKDSESKKVEKKDPASPPLQTASISVRALIEEKIIQRRSQAALTPPMEQLSPQQLLQSTPIHQETYFDGSLLTLSPTTDAQQPQDQLNDVLDAAAASALLSDISSLDLQSYMDTAQQPGDSAIYTDCLTQYLQSGAAESLFESCSFQAQPQQPQQQQFSFPDSAASYPQYFQQPQQLYNSGIPDDFQLLYSIKEEPGTWNSTPFQQISVPEDVPAPQTLIPEPNPAGKVSRNGKRKVKYDEMDEILNGKPYLKYSSLLQQQDRSHYVAGPLLDPQRNGSGLFSHLVKREPIQTIEPSLAKPRINMGKDFQATLLPRCRKDAICKDPDPADQWWSPDSDSWKTDNLISWTQSAGNPVRRKLQPEVAMHFLHSTNGDLPLAKKMILEQNSTNNVEPSSWNAEKISLFADGLKTYGKNFSKIAQTIASTTAADCLQFYYQWKQIYYDDYQALKNHWKTSNNKEAGSCDSCEFAISSSSNNNKKLEASQLADDTKQQPLKTKLYPCSVCNKVYDKVKSRSAHMKTHKSANWDNHRTNKNHNRKYNATLSPSASSSYSSTSSSSSSLPSLFLPNY